MQKLNMNELMSINGGALSKYLIGGIVVGVVFVASVIYGIVNPNGCNR